jgi:type IV pilus assembly protein PilA
MVVIIGVLAVAGTVVYRKYVRASHIEEAQDVIIGIRTAEEAFKSENGVYLDVTGCVGNNCTYPSQTPGAFKTAWGGPCSFCINSWNALAFAPSAPVFYGYSVVADAATAPSGRGVNLTTISQLGADVTNLGAGGTPWYFIEADGNISGDGVNFTHAYGMTGYQRVIVDGADR